MEVQICSTCLQPYEYLYYQRRAADEPPDIVEFCRSCELDARKLDLFKGPTPYAEDKYSTQPLRRSKSVSFPRPATNLGLERLLLVEGSAARRCLRLLRDNDALGSKLQSTTVPINWGSGQELVEFFKDSYLGPEGLILNETKTIAPFVKIVSATKFKLRNGSQGNYDTYVSGYEYPLYNIPFARSSVIRTNEENGNCTILIALEEVGEEGVLAVLSHVLTEYGTEDTIRSFMDQGVTSKMYTQSSKAYDWPSAPRKHYAFTWKPDGERFWCVKYGSVWFFSRRHLSGKIAGWIVGDAISVATDAGPVLDVEVLVNHEPVLIDILGNEDGTATPTTRSLKSVMGLFKSMQERCVPLHVRKYFDSVESLLKTKDKLTYPVDGVVGVEKQTMTIVKLKTTKSIELKLLDNGDLVAYEGNVIARTSLHRKYDPGSIIELRITMNSENGKISVDEALLRTDKLKANSMDVCRNIVNTMVSAPDSLERKDALIWCNTVRGKVHKMASTVQTGGKVVVVIGAGDGQEVGDYSRDTSVSYLLIEPDGEKCKKLFERLKSPSINKSSSNVKLIVGSASFPVAMSTLTNSTVRFIILQSAMRDIVKSKSSLKSMEISAKCCVAPFSISHVSEDIIYLARRGINVIGCGYLYDCISSDGTLVDEAGVTMKCIGGGVSTVKWGSDKQFSEASIVKANFESDMSVVPATRVVPVFRKGNRSLLTTLCNNVYVVLTAGFRLYS